MNKILMIHCGGTLGMVKGTYGYRTYPGSLRDLLFSNSRISSRNFCFKEMKCSCCSRMNGEVDSFITPPLTNGLVVLVDFYELPKILDSSNATTEDWSRIVTVIERYYDKYDGILLIHGTDTLSYAASCVSFMIEGLNLPIIFTGATKPMIEEGSDAESNLLGSIESLLLVKNPGVYIFFNNLLHKGIRTTKVSSDNFNGFYSKNPIRMITLRQDKSSKSRSFQNSENPEKPIFYSVMSPLVGLFKVYPSIHFMYFETIFRVYNAVILETYGAGTFPSHRSDLLDDIRNYIQRGGVVVNVSQCLDGNVMDDYETSYVLSNLGVISAKNMTTECAYAKLSFLLENKPNEVGELFQVPLRGEMEEENDSSLDSLEVMPFIKN